MIDIIYIYIYTLFTHKIRYLGSEEATPEAVFFSKLFFLQAKKPSLAERCKLETGL